MTRGLNQSVLGLRGGFLTKSDFEAHWGKLFRSPEDGQPPPIEGVNSASVDLHLGAEYFVTDLDKPGRLSEESPYLRIPHGEFALLATWEVVQVPLDTIGLISMRYRYKQKGLINISGFHLDPGFSGQIVYSVYNAGPSDLTLKLREPIFTIFLATLIRETESYDGDHQGQRGLSSELVSALGGPPVNLVKVNERLGRLETQLETYLRVFGGLLIGIGVSILTAIVGLLISLVF